MNSNVNEMISSANEVIETAQAYGLLPADEKPCMSEEPVSAEVLDPDWVNAFFGIAPRFFNF
jgi:hypothetical protein